MSNPNGVNINAGCGSTHPEAMAKATLDFGAAIGLAHDGDADRLIVSDETGSLLDGDEMLAVIGLDLLREGKLSKKTLVATVMSNLGLDECFAAAGGTILRAGVGDRYVLEQMLAHDLNVGGEQSGHVILRDHNTTGDGLVTALELLRIMKRTGKPLSELRRGLRKYPQQLVNVKVRERIPTRADSRDRRRDARGGKGIGLAGPRAPALLRNRTENPPARRDPRRGDAQPVVDRSASSR